MQFAALLHRVPRELRSNPQLDIAKSIVGKEDCLKYPLFVINMGETWPFDPLVIAEVDRLDRTPIEKEVILNELYRLGTNIYADHGDRVKAFAEYARISGWTLTKKDEGLKSNDKLAEIAAAILTEEERKNWGGETCH